MRSGRMWSLSGALAISAVLALTGGVASANQGDDQVTAERQPMMRAALKNLNQAKNNLQKATHDKGGHRVAAIGLINQAIDRVEKGIAHDNRNDGEATEITLERQPMMRRALKNLRQAHANLKKASHDKGGHRVAALALIDQAIDRVQKGIAHDNRR